MPNEIIVPDGLSALPLATQRALRRARQDLETRDFAAELADYAGRPVTRVLRLVPKPAANRLNKVVETVILNSLQVAIRSLKADSKAPPARRTATMLAGVSGGVSGFFGMSALALELPMTTTLMLRSIAEIARHQGEDLSTLEARLACIEVFGLGATEPGQRADVGYYASRALLGRLTSDTAVLLLERGASTLSAPVVGNLVTEIATRFGVVVSERSAASALPVLGAIGGAAVNVIFMNHFQRVARGHFVMRRLEREHGIELIRRLYGEIAPPLRASKVRTRRKA